MALERSAGEIIIGKVAYQRPRDFEEIDWHIPQTIEGSEIITKVVDGKSGTRPAAPHA